MVGRTGEHGGVEQLQGVQVCHIHLSQIGPQPAHLVMAYERCQLFSPGQVRVEESTDLHSHQHGDVLGQKLKQDCIRILKKSYS